MLFSPLEQFELGILKGIFLVNSNGLFLDFSFTNLSYFICIVFLIFYLLYFLVYYKNSEKVFANPAQNFIEKCVSFILNLLKENLNWSSILYFTLIFSVFIFILFSNAMGMFPYSFAITGHLVVTFGIAFCIFLGLNIIGYKIHKSHLLSLLLPQGVPFAISSLLIIIEFISYNFRVVSLSVRLFANIMAGHTLLVVIYGFNHYLMVANSSSILIFLVPFLLFPSVVLVIALIGLEFGVALIQAYVFTLLCTTYLHDAKFLH
jgi:ATP synthase subunit 6